MSNIRFTQLEKNVLIFWLKLLQDRYKKQNCYNQAIAYLLSPKRSQLTDALLLCFKTAISLALKEVRMTHPNSDNYSQRFGNGFEFLFQLDKKLDTFRKIHQERSLISFRDRPKSLGNPKRFLS